MRAKGKGSTRATRLKRIEARLEALTTALVELNVRLATHGAAYNRLLGKLVAAGVLKATDVAPGAE